MGIVLGLILIQFCEVGTGETMVGIPGIVCAALRLRVTAFAAQRFADFVKRPDKYPEFAQPQTS